MSLKCIVIGSRSARVARVDSNIENYSFSSNVWTSDASAVRSTKKFSTFVIVRQSFGYEKALINWNIDRIGSKLKPLVFKTGTRNCKKEGDGGGKIIEVMPAFACEHVSSSFRMKWMQLPPLSIIEIAFANPENISMSQQLIYHIKKN